MGIKASWNQTHVCVIKYSYLLLSGRDLIKVSLSQKAVVEELKTQRKRLWQERLEDKVRAEGVAINDYSSLFVERGTVIRATKDYKALNLRNY